MREIRISLVFIVVLLISIGLIFIYSASGVYALQQLGDTTYFLKRHFLFLCIGLVLTLFVMSFDYRQLRPLAKPLLLVTLMMLVMVLIPGIGKATYGARRWFSLGPINF